MARRKNSTAVLVAAAVIGIVGALVAAKYWHPPGAATPSPGASAPPAPTNEAPPGVDRPTPATGLAGELFVGHDRGLPKTSIARADVVAFADLKALLSSLPSDDAMRHHHPPVTEEFNCDRVDEEKRNVKVIAWIYAVKHEDDHDFHVILGSSAVESDCEFMTSEVTGLPASGPDMQVLTHARAEAIDILGEARIKRAHQKYEHPNPPIKVEVQGSLFYDVDHPPGAVGPSGEKPKTAWEIHPVTSVERK